jgi:hypothetical protein
MDANSAMQKKPERRKTKRLLAFVLGCLIVEVAVMPWIAYLAPLSVRAWLPAPMYVLGQRSKAGLLPGDYVLVLGDSYAEGQGDWFDSVWKQGGNPPFQTTHVLHELTKRDVITLGRGGADNVASIVFIASKRFASLKRAGLGEPSDVLLYFYEGNDISDNLRAAHRYMDLEGRALEPLPAPPGGDGRVAATLTADAQPDLRPEIFRLARDRQWTLYELHREAGSLEDLFRQLTTGEGT